MPSREPPEDVNVVINMLLKKSRDLRTRAAELDSAAEKLKAMVKKNGAGCKPKKGRMTALRRGPERADLPGAWPAR